MLFQKKSFRKLILSGYLLLMVLICSQPHTGFGSGDNKFNRFIKELGIKRTIFNASDTRNSKMYLTNLEDNRDLFLKLRYGMMAEDLNNYDEIYRLNREGGKLQNFQTAQFPCELKNARSPVVPTSVHRLRPGDIDVVAALGDSISAGNGILDGNIRFLLSEYRGMAFSGGGLGNWRTFLTLPNILKLFNPDLYGYATAHGLAVDTTSRFSMGEPFLMSRDLPFQARVLVDRILHDSNVDMQHHWKLVTIYIGYNDICCDMCHYDSVEDFLQRHEQDLRHTLRILRDSVPRLLVNLMSVPNMVSMMYNIPNLPLSCLVIRHFFCPCIFSDKYNDAKLQELWHIIDRWQNIDNQISLLPEFQSEDFTVVYQPFTANARQTDLRYLSTDCHHLSQLGHAAMANSLWNNMLQSIGQKQSLEPAFKRIECPTKQRPYIATWRNS